MCTHFSDRVNFLCDLTNCRLGDFKLGLCYVIVTFMTCYVML